MLPAAFVPVLEIEQLERLQVPELRRDLTLQALIGPLQTDNSAEHVHLDAGPLGVVVVAATSE